MSKTYLIKSFLLFFALAPLTGCMTTPGAGEHIGSKNDSYNFSGWMTGPNEDVYLYAMKSFDEWIYVGQAKSRTSSYDYLGTNWHFWSIQTKLPANTWWAYGSVPGANGDYLAIIQARDKYGNPLKNWEEGFYGYFQDYDNLGDMWDAKGHHHSIAIWADD